MKTNKWMLVALPLVAMALTSCADTDELYRGDKYIGSDFINNHYNDWDSNLKAVTEAKGSYTVDASKRFEGSGDKTNPSLSGQNGCKDLADKHSEAVTVNGVQLPWLYNGLDIANFGLANAGELADNSLYEQHQFTQNKKLSLIDSSFSYGILSKLYNGQIRCDAWNSYAYLELDETGYGAMFPKELTSVPNTLGWWFGVARTLRMEPDGSPISISRSTSTNTRTPPTSMRNIRSRSR
jgi:hypothetical protein